MLFALAVSLTATAQVKVVDLWNNSTAPHSNGVTAAETEKKPPYSCAFLWNRRGTCRECAEGTEKIPANRCAVADPFFSGLCPYAEFFYPFRNQYKPYLF